MYKTFIHISIYQQSFTWKWFNFWYFLGFIWMAYGNCKKTLEWSTLPSYKTLCVLNQNPCFKWNCFAKIKTMSKAHLTQGIRYLNAASTFHPKWRYMTTKRDKWLIMLSWTTQLQNNHAQNHILFIVVIIFH